MFYEETLRKLLATQRISSDASVLVVCGSTFDKEVFKKLGFKNVTISNVKPFSEREFLPFDWSYQDAEELTFGDSSFDLVVVHAGLHHCRSPHRALLEMYRAARRVVLVLESRDSFLMRAGVRLRFTADYEIDSPFHDGRGGVRDSEIPNFVYRWSEQEVRKTIQSFAPEYRDGFEFFYKLELPYHGLRSTGRTTRVKVMTMLSPLVWVFTKVLQRQGNRFAFAVYKTGQLQPWLKHENGRIALNEGFKHGFDFPVSAQTPEPVAAPKRPRQI
jgi:SAM-dependent methyltransferase